MALGTLSTTHETDGKHPWKHLIVFGCVLQAYLEAEEIILRAVGRLHPAADRLYLNMGIYYEEAADIDKAFDYFRLWYDVCCDLYGRGHPKTKRCVSTLNESQYKRKSAERNIPVPTENWW